MGGPRVKNCVRIAIAKCVGVFVFSISKGDSLEERRPEKVLIYGDH
jgi:hypothetical protein